MRIAVPVLFLMLMAAATAGAKVEASANGGFLPNYEEGEHFAFAQDGRTVNGGFNSWQAFAESFAFPGSLHASTGAVGTGFAGGSGRAMAAFSDVLTIQNPALTGQQGQFTATLGVDGGLSAVSLGDPYLGDARASVDASFRIQSAATNFDQTLAQSTEQDADRGIVTNTGSLLPYSMVITASFVFGQPIDVSGRIDVAADGSGSGAAGSGGSARSDFSHSGTWGGISSVTVAGNPVAFTVTSVSGTHYVPEPTLGWMTVLGALNLCGLAKMQVAQIRKRSAAGSTRGPN